MISLSSKDRQLFHLAFELAYWIHPNKEIALFVAEDALDSLPSVLGRQRKNRRPSEHLRGFFKWGERTRPIRKTLALNEAQMLQWLVYKESELWERQTERGDGPYHATEEDLIVRYVKYLIFNTVRRGPFYVTLAVGSLLRQFDRRETRLFYDVLTQSDLARMKDANYVGKQRLELLDQVSNRFTGLTEIRKNPGEEKHFVLRPKTQRVVEIVNECLHRFTPWQTTCVLQRDFDVTDIPELSCSESNLNEDEEEIIAMNRTHTALHPRCFSLFCDGLAKHVRSLPIGDFDRRCDYGSIDERLAVPQFSGFGNERHGGDRFQPPKLSVEDYIRVQRLLDARRHRRNSFVPEKISLYVDGDLKLTFNASDKRRAQFIISDETACIEVRGEDRNGELTMAILPTDHYPRIPFKASIPAGAGKVKLELTRAEEKDNVSGNLQVRVTYSQPTLKQWIGRVFRALIPSTNLASHAPVATVTRSRTAFTTASVSGFVILIFSLGWWWFSLSPSLPVPEPESPIAQKPQLSPPFVSTPVASPSSTPLASAPPTRQVDTRLFARAVWTTDPKTALVAIPIETTRSDDQAIDFSRRQGVLSLPAYADDGQLHSRYRLTLSSGGTRLWQQSLQAPNLKPNSYAHLLDLSIRSNTHHRSYQLEIAAKTKQAWKVLGKISLNVRD